MRYASVFAGIGGFDAGFEASGWTPVCQVEVDTVVEHTVNKKTGRVSDKKNITGRYAKMVLQHHWPDVPLLNDVREVHGHDLGLLDVLVGGFPCQDLSIAAPYRKGLAGQRSHLFFEFARLVDEYARIVDESNPRWVILENVEGLLSSNGGADMERVLHTLADLGYVGTWRVVDALSFGIPQRRRRVLVVGHRGDFPGVGEVLGDAGPGGLGPGLHGERAEAPSSGLPAGRGTALDGGGPRRPRTADEAQLALQRLIFRKASRARSTAETGGYSTWKTDDYSNTLNGFDGTHLVSRAQQLLLDGGRVRALTLREWERLMGFPDDWTDVPGMKESYRWTLLGNALCPPVARWLAGNINAVPTLAAI